jgi:hypothetical protein
MSFWATLIVIASIGAGVLGEEGGKNYATLEECNAALPAFSSKMIEELKAKDVTIEYSKGVCAPGNSLEMAKFLKQKFPTLEELKAWMHATGDRPA